VDYFQNNWTILGDFLKVLGDPLVDKDCGAIVGVTALT